VSELLHQPCLIAAQHQQQLPDMPPLLTQRLGLGLPVFAWMAAFQAAYVKPDKKLPSSENLAYAFQIFLGQQEHVLVAAALEQRQQPASLPQRPLPSLELPLLAARLLLECAAAAAANTNSSSLLAAIVARHAVQGVASCFSRVSLQQLFAVGLGPSGVSTADLIQQFVAGGRLAEVAAAKCELLAPWVDEALPHVLQILKTQLQRIPEADVSTTAAAEHLGRSADGHFVAPAANPCVAVIHCLELLQLLSFYTASQTRNSPGGLQGSCHTEALVQLHC
jgi:hypothetical protein